MIFDRLDVPGLMVVVSAFFLVYGFVMTLVIIGLTGHLAEKADRHLSVLTTEKDPLFQLVNLSAGRLGWYGCLIVLRRIGLTRRWPLTGRPGRVGAIDAAPRWLKHVLVWIYFGFFFSGLMFFSLGGMGMLIDKYFV